MHGRFLYSPPASHPMSVEWSPMHSSCPCVRSVVHSIYAQKEDGAIGRIDDRSFRTPGMVSVQALPAKNDDTIPPEIDARECRCMMVSGRALVAQKEDVGIPLAIDVLDSCMWVCRLVCTYRTGVDVIPPVIDALELPHDDICECDVYSER